MSIFQDRETLSWLSAMKKTRSSIKYLAELFTALVMPFFSCSAYSVSGDIFHSLARLHLNKLGEYFGPLPQLNPLHENVFRWRFSQVQIIEQFTDTCKFQSCWSHLSVSLCGFSSSPFFRRTANLCAQQQTINSRVTHYAQDKKCSGYENPLTTIAVSN